MVLESSLRWLLQVIVLGTAGPAMLAASGAERRKIVRGGVGCETHPLVAHAIDAMRARPAFPLARVAAIDADFQAFDQHGLLFFCHCDAHLPDHALRTSAA